MSAAFNALADPTRRTIVAGLRSGPRTVNEIAEGLPVSQPAVSKHLKVLEDAGLITRAQVGTTRPARLVPDVFVQIDAWLGEYRTLFGPRFARLDDLPGDPEEIDNAADPHNAHGTHNRGPAQF